MPFIFLLFSCHFYKGERVIEVLTDSPFRGQIAAVNNKGDLVFTESEGSRFLLKGEKGTEWFFIFYAVMPDGRLSRCPGGAFAGAGDVSTDLSVKEGFFAELILELVSQGFVWQREELEQYRKICRETEDPWRIDRELMADSVLKKKPRKSPALKPAFSLTWQPENHWIRENPQLNLFYSGVHRFYDSQKFLLYSLNAESPDDFCVMVNTY